MKRFSTHSTLFLKPLAYMVKDVIDTFKPYKSSWYICRDLLQPIYGLGFVLLSILGAGFSLKHLFKGKIDLFISDALTACSLLIRGLTLVIATPLTWFIRMPLRGIITLFTGFQRAEEGKGIQREVQRGKKVLKNINSLNNKLKKAKNEANSLFYSSKMIKLKQEADQLEQMVNTIHLSIWEKFKKAKLNHQKSNVELRPYALCGSEGVLNFSLFQENLKKLDRRAEEWEINEDLQQDIKLPMIVDLP